MKKLIIDREEGKYFICEDKNKSFFAIETSEMHKGAKSGDVIEIDDNGKIMVNTEETKRRKENLNKRLSNIVSKE